jgi:hypothetical protein
MNAYHGPSRYVVVSKSVNYPKRVAYNHYVADAVTGKLITTLGAFGVLSQAVAAAEDTHRRSFLFARKA